MSGATRDIGRDPGLSSSVDDSRLRGLASKRGFGADSHVSCVVGYVPLWHPANDAYVVDKDICGHHLASLLKGMAYNGDRPDPCWTSNILIVSCMTGSGRASLWVICRRMWWAAPTSVVSCREQDVVRCRGGYQSVLSPRFDSLSATKGSKVLLEKLGGRGMPTFFKVELETLGSHSLILFSYQANFNGRGQIDCFYIHLLLRLVPNALDLTWIWLCLRTWCSGKVGLSRRLNLQGHWLNLQKGLMSITCAHSFLFIIWSFVICLALFEYLLAVVCFQVLSSFLSFAFKPCSYTCTAYLANSLLDLRFDFFFLVCSVVFFLWRLCCLFRGSVSSNTWIAEVKIQVSRRLTTTYPLYQVYLQGSYNNIVIRSCTW
jgi:hypothetical protein